MIVRALRLYPLLDAGVSAHGLSFADLHGDNYVKTRDMSAFVHDRTTADGILYSSRFDNQCCIALFDRASVAVEVTAASRMAISPSEAERLAGHLGTSYFER